MSLLKSDDQNILPRSWFIVSIKTWKNACLLQLFFSRLKYSASDLVGLGGVDLFVYLLDGWLVDCFVGFFNLSGSCHIFYSIGKDWLLAVEAQAATLSSLIDSHG